MSAAASGNDLFDRDVDLGYRCAHPVRQRMGAAAAPDLPRALIPQSSPRRRRPSGRIALGDRGERHVAQEHAADDRQM
jgi:hypothetical protein